MGERSLIIRLDGDDLDRGASSLLLYEIEGSVEVVVTEEHGGDAVIVLSREQTRALARSLRVALGETRGENES